MGGRTSEGNWTATVVSVKDPRLRRQCRRRALTIYHGPDDCMNLAFALILLLALFTTLIASRDGGKRGDGCTEALRTNGGRARGASDAASMALVSCPSHVCELIHTSSAS